MHADTWAAIGLRLGFVPPFFAPARDNPVQLANLWHQTELAYLDNPLPALFKEKLAALLGRSCEVPYCLVCHSCTLRPLGMSGKAVLALLQTPVASDEELAAAVARLAGDGVGDPGLIDVAAIDESTEADLFTLASAVYFGGASGGLARDVLRRRLAVNDFQAVIAFSSYNKMCHEWMVANPEVSFELDRRYLDNEPALVADAPELRAFVSTRALLRQPSTSSSAPAARAAETERLATIAERRFDEVLGLLEAELAHVSSTDDRDRLERALSFSQELLAVVSHDLRSPLSAIQMSAAVLQARLPEQASTSTPLRRIITSAERAERLIRDLLDFSQARMGGQIPLYKVDVDVHAVVRDVVAEVQSTAPKTAFSLAISGETTASLDPDRLGQVLTNLLANAVSHGPVGEAVAVTVDVDTDDVVITVDNANRNGAIPAALLPVLFQPFKQGVRLAASKTRSIGLGLYIVEHLVTAHGGRIDVKSTAERTRFTVRVPRRTR